MEYLLNNFGFVQASLIALFVIFFRYLLFAGIPFIFFYKWKRDKLKSKRIQKYFPKKEKIFSEIKNSFITTIIFTAFAWIIYLLKINGYTKIYQDIDTYGIPYFTVSIVVMLLLHDTYFYWMHRAVHHPKLFGLFHKTHHLSRNPTPFASFSFDVAEAFAEILIFPILVLLFPVHPLALVIVFNISLIFNVMGHLGYEFLPSWFVTHPILKWINTSTHHNMHHKLANANYGLYFNFWDAWLGTNHKNYVKTFTKLAEK